MLTLILLTLLFSSYVKAKNLSPYLTLKTGYTQNIDSLNWNLSDSNNNLSGNYLLALSFTYPLPHLLLHKEIALTLPWTTSIDTYTHILSFFLTLTVGYPIARFIEFQLGLTSFHSLYFPKVGEINLNNGNSITTFYSPYTLQHTSLWGIISALHAWFSSKIFAEIRIGILNPHLTPKQALTSALLLGMKL